MEDDVKSVNALVEQEAAKNAANAGGETPEQIAAKAAAAAGETPEQIAAREAAAKGATETPEQIAEREAAAAKAAASAPDPVQLQKKIDELEKALADKNDKVDKSPEQIKKDEEVYQAKLKAYAVENDLMKSDDLHRYDTIKGSADEDLVFNAFAAEVKDEILEDLPEDATEEEIIAAIKKEFENEYPLNSKSEKVKARAEAKLKKAAGEIRNPLESSFNSAKARFDDETTVRTEYPKYQEAIKKFTSDIVPDKISFFKNVEEGDEEVDIPVTVPEEVKKEILESIEKIVKDPENFLLHKNGKTEEVRQKIKREVDFLMWERLGDEGKKEIAKIYHGRGLAKGSTGAQNSFPVNQGGGLKPESKTGLSANQEVIESTRKK